MYQPGHGRFEVADATALLAELSAEHPATLVSVGPDGFRTTILPMLLYPAEGESGILRGHFARGNPHWRELGTDGRAVAIFSGPDAYISPAWYEEKRLTGKVVPTWNYVTVAVHGTVVLHPEPDWLLAHVRRLVERHEAGQAEPWSIDDAPDGYVETQARAIVGLELHIARIEAKRKLNQNRSAADIEGVIEALGEGTPREQAVAAEMRREDAR
ncbi:MAG TPA: FMN-binding negative transcriptional regulator [Candidatus Limnocylindrales bacterium]|jgi:transcriptional regulator|nr:FMN-binding negative transcriptional regulator [Candidatus Limnocylindrales bacterium]